MVLARSDAGLEACLVPLQQAGVSVEPVLTFDTSRGHSSVTFDGAEAEARSLVAELATGFDAEHAAFDDETRAKLERREEQIPLTFVLTAVLWLQRELFGGASSAVATSAHLAGAAVGTYFGHRLHVRKTWWGGHERRFED